MKRIIILGIFCLLISHYLVKLPLLLPELKNKEKIRIDFAEDLSSNYEINYSFLPDINYYEDYVYYLPLINAIVKVESDGNPYAINPKGQDSGLLQQRLISVDEANRISNLNFSYSDRFNPSKQIQMFLIIQRQHNPEKNYQKASRIWNGWDHKCIKPETEYYWKKVQKALKENHDYEYLWNEYITKN